MTEPAASAKRTVVHGDAIEWLHANGVVEGASIVTSLPDSSELPGVEHPAWERWFSDAAELCARAVCERSIAVFYQTDTHFDGRWVDKAALVRAGVERVGARCLFHWVVLRAPIGTRSHNRAGYSHLLGFSREATLDRAQPFCDVLAEAGPATWTRGMGLHACRVACEAVRASCASRTILDPFCGHGTVLAVANELGFDAIGVELGRRRAKRARALTVEQLVARAVAVEEEEER